MLTYLQVSSRINISGMTEMFASDSCVHHLPVHKNCYRLSAVIVKRHSMEVASDVAVNLRPLAFTMQIAGNSLPCVEALTSPCVLLGRH